MTLTHGGRLTWYVCLIVLAYESSILVCGKLVSGNLMEHSESTIKTAYSLASFKTWLKTLKLHSYSRM